MQGNTVGQQTPVLEPEIPSNKATKALVLQAF
jgi:hypothetical protein